MDASLQMQDDLIRTSIFEAAMRLHETLDASEVVARALEILPEVVEAESWAVFLKAEQAERLELVRAINATALPIGPFVDLDATSIPIVRATRERRIVITNNRDEDSTLQARSENEACATLCVPLFTRGRLIGAVQAMRKASLKSFSQEETRVLELLCGSLVRALANAIDYHDATRQTLDRKS